MCDKNLKGLEFFISTQAFTLGIIPDIEQDV
jgi:hypothetical protein